MAGALFFATHFHHQDYHPGTTAGCTESPSATEFSPRTSLLQPTSRTPGRISIKQDMDKATSSLSLSPMFPKTGRRATCLSLTPHHIIMIINIIISLTRKEHDTFNLHMFALIIMIMIHIMMIIIMISMTSRACCREVKIPNQYGRVILWCLFMYRIDS